MVVTLDAKRRLTVPTALAPTKPGDYFDAHFDAEDDAIVFRRLGGRENWLAVMKAHSAAARHPLSRHGAILAGRRRERYDHRFTILFFRLDDGDEEATVGRDVV